MRVIPWKYVVTLQFVLISSVFTQTVPFTQFVVPFAPFFTKATTLLSWDEVGYVSGSLASSYLLGRGLSTPIWVYLADSCGRRAVLSLCFMFWLVLSMFFGLCSTLQAAVLVRFCLGLFAPAYSLAQSLLGELASPCMENMSSVSIVTTITAICSHTAALLIGSLMVPNIDTDPLIQHFLFLTPSLICASVTLFAFIAFFVDFPETLPIALELKKRAKQAAEQPAKRPAGTYVELAEMGNGNSEEVKAEIREDVVTERKEHKEEEEEIPNYLMHFAAQEKLEVREEIAEEKASMGKQIARFFSPRHADCPKVNLGPRPNTARANTFTHPLPDIDEPKERIENRKSQIPSVPDCKPANDGEEFKRTHISFFEEDFDPAEMSSAAYSSEVSAAPTLADKFRRRDGSGVWGSASFRSSLAHVSLLTICVTGVKGAVLIWLIVERAGLELSVGALGLVLAGSETCAKGIQAIIMPRIVFYQPLNQFGLFTCVLLALITVAIPFSDTLQSRVASILTAFILLTLFEYLSSLLLTIEVLKLSDSVSPEMRETAMRWSSGLGSLAKAAGSIGGPALFAATLTGVLGLNYHWLFAGAAGVMLGSAGIMMCDKHKFPRFNISPYEV